MKKILAILILVIAISPAVWADDIPIFSIKTPSEIARDMVEANAKRHGIINRMMDLFRSGRVLEKIPIPNSNYAVVVTRFTDYEKIDKEVKSKYDFWLVNTKTDFVSFVCTRYDNGKWYASKYFQDTISFGYKEIPLP